MKNNSKRVIKVCLYLWKLLTTNFIAKEPQILCDILGSFENILFLSDKCCGYVLGNILRKLGLFYSNT